MRFIVGAVFCQFMLALQLVAQETGTTPEDPSLSSLVLENGGVVMYVLFGLSTVAIFLAVLFLLTMTSGGLMPDGFRRAALTAAQNGDVDAVLDACENNSSAGAGIVGVSARHLAGNPDADSTSVRNLLEDEGGRQANTMWQRIQYLQDIAVIAPMVGLLGTVLGMITAFTGIQGNTGVGQVLPIALSEGVSKALVTTAGGIVVGIIAMVLYSFFRGHVNRVVSHLESSCAEIVETLLSNRKGS